MSPTDYLNNLLLMLLGDPLLIAQWWDSPNLAFEGQCPKDVPEAQVKAYLEGHCFG